MSFSCEIKCNTHTGGRHHVAPIVTHYMLLTHCDTKNKTTPIVVFSDNACKEKTKLLGITSEKLMVHPNLPETQVYIQA